MMLYSCLFCLCVVWYGLRVVYVSLCDVFAMYCVMLYGVVFVVLVSFVCAVVHVFMCFVCE